MKNATASKGASSRARIKAESFYWLLIIAFFAIWIPYRFFIPLSLHVRHTYQLPAAACSNRLTSDRWTWEFVREGLFTIFLLLPLSGMFMIWTRSRTGLWTHVVLVVALLIWGVVMVGYDVEDIRTANLPPNSNQYNPSNLATDNQWCLVYGGQPGTEIVCANTAPCPGATSAVSFEDLAVDGAFAFRVSFNAFLLCFCLADLIFAVYTWRKVLNDWLEPQEPQSAPLVEQKVWSRPKSRAEL